MWFWISLGLVLLVFAFYYFKGGLSISSMLGYSVSATDREISVSGKVLSVIKNGEVLMGDIKLTPTNSNTISQNTSQYAMTLKGGHIVVKGNVDKIKINGKQIESKGIL